MVADGPIGDQAERLVIGVSPGLIRLGARESSHSVRVPPQREQRELHEATGGAPQKRDAQTALRAQCFGDAGLSEVSFEAVALLAGDVTAPDSHDRPMPRRHGLRRRSSALAG